MVRPPYEAGVSALSPTPVPAQPRARDSYSYTVPSCALRPACAMALSSPLASPRNKQSSLCYAILYYAMLCYAILETIGLQCRSSGFRPTSPRSHVGPFSAQIATQAGSCRETSLRGPSLAASLKKQASNVAAVERGRAVHNR